MNIRTCAALLLAAGLPTAVFAVDYPEVEPNETKAQALTNGAFTLVAGDSVSGTTTGTSTTTAGAASADTFLVKTGALSLGIYRHRLTITTAGTAGHTGLIRGLASTSTGATAGGDSSFQSSGSAASGTTPARTNQWYGFGKQEQLYYRVTGGASTTATYTSTLATDVVTVTAFPSNPEAGSMTIMHTTATDSAYDRDMFLFDSNFNPIYGIDDADTTALSVTLSPGNYYIGYGRYQTAAGPFAGSSVIQGTFQTGTVLDFSDVVASTATGSSTVPVGITITAPNGATTATGVTMAGSFDVAWFSFTVAPAVTPTNPTGTGTASPNIVINDGTGVTTLSVTVVPGANPTSTFLTTGTVTVNGASIGAGTVTLLDNGVAPDAVAGDNVFAAYATVANGTAGGAATLPFTITDDQARVGTGNIALTVSTPPPACPGGAATLSFSGVQSDGALGDVDNSIATGDFGIGADINVLNITGRLISNGTPYNTETRIQATSPDGSIFLIQPFPTGTSVSPRDLTSFTYTLATNEPGTGTWTFQFYESYDDGVTPDATWQQICFGADLAPTNPTATGVATPNTGVNDGTGSTVLKVTVVPGANPVSTFVSTGTVTVNAATIGAGTVTLLDNGVAPDDVAGDLVFSASATVANGTAAGAATLPFTVIDDQGRSAAAGNIAFTVTTPPPACPAGQATLSFANVSSDGLVGDPDNSIVTGDFGFGDYVNVIRMSGRLVSNGTPYNLEARVQATTPDGHIYQFQPFTTTPSTSPRDLATATFNLANLEAGVGTWTFEFFESYNDGVTPDATWTSACFGIDQAATPLAATAAAAPTTVVRDGVASTTLKVTVAPGHFPESTGIAVVVDDTSIGGSGSLTLLDDGVFPDVAINDNIFTASTTVAYTTALGTATLPYTVTDAESGSATGNINFTVTEASGACCTGSGCIVTTIGDCLDVQAGTFAGTNTACVAPTALTTEGAGAFEDISATGAATIFTNYDDGNATVTLPFTFNYFGTDYSSINVVTNGFAEFSGTDTTYTNTTLPSVALPNNALYPLWDDHDLDVAGEVYTEMLGTIGTDARFIIQWNAGQYNLGNAPIDNNVFQIALFEDGSFEFRYQTIGQEVDGSSGAGDTTTIGFEDSTGANYYQSPLTRATLAAQLPYSVRGNSAMNDTGVCGNGCAPCAADFDNNGGIDGADLAAFFTAYEAGETCGDVDNNGGIDGADLAYFFSVYEAGGC